MARPGVRIPPVTLYSVKSEIESAFQKATRPWTCLTCRKQFSLFESMGSLDCAQHPGHIQENGVWSCCGQKIYPVRRVHNFQVLRMFPGQCPTPPAKVAGCQKCDHNTSGKTWTHSDAVDIADLSALLPFMEQELSFALRTGFSDGVLRRCEIRGIHCPAIPGASVEYMDNDGNNKTHIVGDGPVPEGMELSASNEGVPILNWWST